MRFSHYLLRSPSGIYYLRLRVPRALQAALGLRVVKRSLHTRDRPTAGACAQLMALRYAQAFAVLRGAAMPKMPSVDELVTGLREGHSKDYHLEIDPVTRVVTKLITDGTEQNHAQAMEAIRQATGQAVPSEPAQRRSSFVLSAAIRVYTAAELQDAPETTRRHREAAFKSFVEYFKPNARMSDITKPEVGQWAQGLMENGLTKRTVTNYVSTVAQVFEMLISRGELTSNPVKGVVVMTYDDKQKRINQGYTWEPFELADLKRIFDPTNYRKMRKAHAYWGPLLGLYTGARVAEIAQLFLRDFIKKGGRDCINIAADSDGQSVKNESSKRLVPLHPDLLKLGLLDYVEELRKRGEERLFPLMRIDSKAGAGNSISKAFSYYLSGLNIKPRRKNGTVGFHSLRKNVIQELQGSELSEERRRALVGHENGERRGDVHKEVYQRAWTADELAKFFPGLSWGEWMDVAALRKQRARAAEEGRKQ